MKMKMRMMMKTMTMMKMTINLTLFMLTLCVAELHLTLLCILHTLLQCCEPCWYCVPLCCEDWYLPDVHCILPFTLHIGKQFYYKVWFQNVNIKPCTVGNTSKTVCTWKFLLVMSLLSRKMFDQISIYSLMILYPGLKHWLKLRHGRNEILRIISMVLSEKTRTAYWQFSIHYIELG